VTGDCERRGRSGLGPDCRAFLRQLSSHVDRALQPGGPDDGHAGTCQACAQRLASALGQAALLKVAPPIPVALKSRAAYEAVLARVIEELEASPSGALLGRAAPVAPEADAMWPEPCDELARALSGAMSPDRIVPGGSRLAPGGVQVVPGWVWLRIKDHIRAEVARRSVVRIRWRRSRSIAVAAALVVGALLILPFGRGRVPAGELDPIIVMQRMDHTPVIDYLPTAVLRHGGG